MLAFQERLRRLVGHPRDAVAAPADDHPAGWSFVGAVYGGYFGAALGVMLVAGWRWCWTSR